MLSNMRGMLLKSPLQYSFYILNQSEGLWCSSHCSNNVNKFK
jgi:hypothetical protein